MKKKAVFLDRDGNINRDVGYPESFSKIEVYPYSYEAIRKIRQSGLLSIIVTNQSGVGRGLISEKNLQSIHKEMKALFERHNAPIDGIYYCPHYLRSSISRYRKDCSCRKPKPGMAKKAAADFDIALSKSYVIGDKAEDVLFALNIQACPILVLTGYGRKSLSELQKQKILPDYVAADLLDAVNWIWEKEKRQDLDSSLLNSSKKI